MHMHMETCMRAHVCGHMHTSLMARAYDDQKIPLMPLISTVGEPSTTTPVPCRR